MLYNHAVYRKNNPLPNFYVINARKNMKLIWLY